MCGRKHNLPSLSWDVYRDLFEFDGAASPSNFAPNFNIAPTHEVPLIGVADGERFIRPMRWGLLPFWAKEKKIGYSMINAKAETVEEKRSFSPSLKNRRCIIPVSGFYEWKRKSKTEKQAFAIQHRAGEPLLLAGLWTTNSQIDDGEKIESYTVMTRAPNELVAEIHNRMPVILRPSQIKTWLEEDWGQARSCLDEPFPASIMKSFAVSNDVGNVRNNYPELLHPL